MERLIRLSIRSHWILLLIPILVQYFIGAAIISNKPLLPMPDVIPYLPLLPFSPDRIFEAHIIMGNVFVMIAAVLTMEKAAVIFWPIKRAPIPNAFVSSHVQVLIAARVILARQIVPELTECVQGHFLGVGFQFMFQYVTMMASQEVTAFIKVRTLPVRSYFRECASLLCPP